MEIRNYRRANRSRLFVQQLAFLALLFGALVAPGAAQLTSQDFVLVVVPPPGMVGDDPLVEEWVTKLKQARRRRNKTPGQLPILRMLPSIPEHANLLRTLGIVPGAQLRTYLCQRDTNDRPLQLRYSYQPEDSGDKVMMMALDNRVPELEPQVPVITRVPPEIGLLLVYDRSQEAQLALVEGVLNELGRYWLERYGRTRPSPYPLAYYNLQDETTRTRVEAAFPELFEKDPPVLALCRFEEGRPSSVLAQFRGLDTPASAVRILSARRSRFLSGEEMPEAADAGDAPLPESLGLNSEMEITLLLSRLNETAQQLWDAAKEDQDEGNRGGRRILLQICELSRKARADEAESLLALREALKDYEVEPLRISNSSRLGEVHERFRQLSQALLETL